MSDDQRADTVGVFGRWRIVTPNLDELVSRGVVFANHFVTTSICPVSRASIFTGQYARHHGVWTFREPLTAELRGRSYFRRLRDAGYAVGFVGKWGLGGDLPSAEFDYFEGYGGQGRYFEDEGSPHLTKRLGDRTLQGLGSLSEGGRPFCLSVSFKAPHAQDQKPPYFICDPTYDNLYRDASFEPPPDARTAYRRLPAMLRGAYEGRVRWKRRFATPRMYQESVRRYFQLITGVDAQVGRVLEHLERLGLADNTVVLYTSDNGFFLGEHGLAGKWTMHEPSIRVPLIVYDPRSAARGQRRVQMTLNLDIAPTMLEFAGIDPPPGTDGESLVPFLLEGGERLSGREDWYYEHDYDHPRIPRIRGVRTRRWKYVHYESRRHGEAEQLMRVDSDREEAVEPASEPGAARRMDLMRERLAEWGRALDQGLAKPERPLGKLVS